MLTKNFLNNLISLEKSEYTIKAYSKDLNDFKDHLFLSKGIQDINLDNIKDITIFDFDDFMSYLKQKKLSGSTIIRKIATISSFFDFLKRRHIIERNITQDIERPKKPDNLPICLSEAEAIKLVDETENIRNKTMIAFLLNTGLRISELMKLNTEDIKKDFYFTVNGKGKKQRLIKLPKYCVGLLGQYLKVRKSSIGEKALFISNKGNRMSIQAAQTMVKNLAKKILNRQDITVHKLRHSFCTIGLQNGTDLITLQAQMGHSDIKTTELYTHLNKKHLGDAFENNSISAKMV